MRLSGIGIMSKSGSGATNRGDHEDGDVLTSALFHDGRLAPANGDGMMTVSPRPEVAEAVADFESVRSRLFGIAYRMLGSTADADDVVQDVWIRWQGADREQVHDRVAFLVTITRRVALNAATSARARHEVCAGHWLPERAVPSADPALGAERTEELGLAVLLMLLRLSPIERAIFVLREAFNYPFREIAEALQISESNARQLARRARTHLSEQRHEPVVMAERDRLLEHFLGAARVGDMARLKSLLADDIKAVRPRCRAAS